MEEQKSLISALPSSLGIETLILGKNLRISILDHPSICLQKVLFIIFTVPKLTYGHLVFSFTNCCTDKRLMLIVEQRLN